MTPSAREYWLRVALRVIGCVFVLGVYPLTVLWPGLIVTLVVVALNLFGDALRDAADPLTNPRLRGAR